MSRARTVANFGAGISAANVTGLTQGVTDIDTWRLNNSVNPTLDSWTTLASNWERSDGPYSVLLGNGMSQSNGQFTFPSTGIWLVQTGLAVYDQNGDVIEVFSRLRMSSDSGSTYTGQLNLGVGSIGPGFASNQYPRVFPTTSKVVDVINASTYRIKLEYYVSNGDGPQIEGNTDYDRTFLQFIRLGDT